jgi:hypothetical protein
VEIDPGDAENSRVLEAEKAMQVLMQRGDKTRYFFAYAAHFVSYQHIVAIQSTSIKKRIEMAFAGIRHSIDSSP